MVLPGTPHPDRIQPDAIIEAVFEIRFDMVSPLPEVLFGRLAEVPAWKNFSQKKMPAYDIPAFIRDSDANLRFQPVLELSSTASPVALRVGAHVISYHRTAPYPGWPEFADGLDAVTESLFSKADGLAIRRLGLRYVNALTAADHQVRSTNDLDLSVQVSQMNLAGRLNLNFSQDADRNKQCTVRIATREFVQGPSLADDAILVDIDVYTPDNYLAETVQQVKDWAAEARRVKNNAFFGLLTSDTIRRLGAAR